MATITKRGASWQVKIRLQAEHISKSFPTKYLADQFAATEERRIKSGIKQASSDFLVPWLEGLADEVGGKKASAYRRLAGVTAFKRVPFSKLTVSVIACACEELLEDDLSTSSVRRYLTVLSGLITKRAIPSGLILSNPLSRFPLPPDAYPRDFRVVADDLLKLVIESDSEMLPYIILLAVETAMRRGELARLTWDRVFWDAKNILLRPQDTKTRKGRTIPLSSRALSYLSDIKQNSGLVFGLAPDSISQAFTRAASRCELSHLHFHDLRHEATSRLFERGLSVMEVKAITGHETMRMLDRYTHLNPMDVLSRLG